YLVADAHAEAFLSAVAGAADGLPGVRVEVTGPWAPYSFATAPPGPDEAP
ncbi:gas vesicle protein, partial [Streptomyces sp. RSD-27]